MRSGRTSGAGQNGIDRAHVRDDGATPKPGQLTGQRGLEARSTECLVRRPEGAHAAVLRKNAFDRAVGEHHDLVDELRERADLRDRRGKRGMPGVDLLRDEDELGHELLDDRWGQAGDAAAKQPPSGIFARPETPR